MDIQAGDCVMIGVFMAVAKEDSVPMDTGKHSVLLEMDFTNPVGHTISLVTRVDDEFVTVTQWDHNEGGMADSQIDRRLILEVIRPRPVGATTHA